MASLQKLDTILYEVQQACLQLSLPAPSGVYDSQDDNAQMMGSVANLAGIMVSEAIDWQQLHKTFSITGDGVKTAWDLPDDFSHFVDGTGWSFAIRQPIVVVNSQQWASLNAWVPKLTVSPICQISADQLQFLTPPQAGGLITIEYLDANWVINGQAPPVPPYKQKLTHNADMPRFDWLLMVLAIKTKWLEQKGMNTTAAQADFNERLSQLDQRNQMGQVLTLSGPVPGAMQPLLSGMNTPDTGFG